MASKQKLYLKAINNPNGLRYQEFVSLVEAFGFAFERQTGSHRMHFRTGIPELVNIQPTKDGKAKDYQVVRFLKLVERYELRLEEAR